ncbi:MAG: M23 family metallopeptidase [Gammaproteobacteria bacterium]
MTLRASRHAWVAVLCAAGNINAVAADAPVNHCMADTICVDGEWRSSDSGRQLVFTARNLSEFPVTVTLNLRSTAFANGPPEDVITTVQPRATTALANVMALSSEEAAPEYHYKFEWDFGVANVLHDDDYLYRLPYAAGKSYRILQGYGSRFSHTGNEHYSVDFDMPRGTPVHAARDGVVMEMVEKFGEGCWEARCRRTANYINVLHDDGSTGEYYHLLRDSAEVAVGDKITRGQFLARSGNSGHSTMPHLHFGVYESIAWGRTRSLPVRYDSVDGVVDAPGRRQRHVAR